MKLARRLTLAALLAGGLLRLAHWGAPVTSDEGYMLEKYVNGGFSHIVRSYVPNNQMLLSLILRAIDVAWPKKLVLTLADPRPLQAPSLLAAFASLWLLAGVAASLAGPVAALFSVLALSFSYWHLMYSHMLRGYSLATTLELAAVWLGLRALRTRRAAPLFAAAVCAAAAHYALPSNAVLTLALAAALWAARGPARKAKKARPPLSGAAFAAAAVLCAALTLAAYGPVLADVARSRALYETGTLRDVLAAALEPLGRSAAFGAALACAAACGLAASASGGRRSRRAAAICAVAIAAPPIVYALEGLAAPARAYLPALPFWCLAFGLAARAAWARVARLLPRGPARRLAAPALAALAAGAFATQALAYWRWDRGLDPRDALARAAARERDADDFVVIAADRGDDPRFGEIDWEYYGFAASLEPYIRLAVDRDVAYESRARYVVLASDEARARRALEESGADAVLSEGLRFVERSGRLGLYEARRDPAAISRYLEIAKGRGPAAAAALTALGADALSRGDYAAALAPLERAKSLAPEDERARFQLARAFYLTFDDRRAAEELEWTVARDSMNAHAPLLLADCLAQLGRPREASRRLAWYGEAGRPAQAWTLQELAKQASAALAGGQGPVRLAGGSAAAWLEVARENQRKAAYPRAAAAIERARRSGPVDPSWLWQLASIRASMHDYAAAARLFREALAAGGPAGLRVPLARVLRNQNDFDGARAELARFRPSDPDDPYLQALDAELLRL